MRAFLERVFATGYAAAGAAAVGCRLRPAPDGWRHTVGVALRAESSKFTLSAFGLNLPADFPAALRRQLHDQPVARVWLHHTPAVVRRVPAPFLDVVEQHFRPDGSLENIREHLDPGGPPAPPDWQRAAVRSAVVKAYNRTRHCPETVRPGMLAGDAATGPDDAFVRRLLCATCVSAGPGEPGDARFEPPPFCRRRPLGGGGFAVLVRPVAGGTTADVWLNVHHVAADGSAAQELLHALEKAWPAAGEVQFPAAGTVFGPRLAGVPGEGEIYESLAFIDFAPLFAYRRKVKAAGVADVPVAPLLAWLLAGTPAFAGAKIATTVDLLAVGKRDRAVDLLPQTPATLPRTPAGLAAFATQYRDMLTASRARTGAVYKRLQTTALLPAKYYRDALRANPQQVADTFGDACVSVVRGAQIVVGSLGDIGYRRGFLAVGRMDLPAAGGGTVGAVSIKGTHAQAAAYPAAVRAAVAAA